jgi:hypothetical protein
MAAEAVAPRVLPALVGAAPRERAALLAKVARRVTAVRRVTVVWPAVQVAAARLAATRAQVEAEVRQAAQRVALVRVAVVPAVAAVQAPPVALLVNPPIPPTIQAALATCPIAVARRRSVWASRVRWRLSGEGGGDTKPRKGHEDHHETSIHTRRMRERGASFRLDAGVR